MSPLVNQAPEVLHDIFQNVGTRDLASLCLTCKELNEFIKKDTLLWKRHYLSQFDRPSGSGSSETLWQHLTKSNVLLERILVSGNDDYKKDDDQLERVCNTAFDLLINSTAEPINNTNFLTNHFASESNISSFLCRSSLFRRCRRVTDRPASSERLRQLSAKLHVFCNTELEPALSCSEEQNAAILPVHPCARSRVYDLRRYRTSNLWGPFMDDGSQRVDWEKIQAIVIDLRFNIRMYTDRRPSAPLVTLSPGSSSSTASTTSASSTSSTPASSTTSSPRRAPWNGLWGDPFTGLAPNSYLSQTLAAPIAAPLNPDLDALDPYGVTGTWMRIVCFLDYNDLYAFNFESGWIPTNQEREPVETREAFRLIRLQLHVVRIDPPGEDDGKDYPVVHFQGKSRSTFMAWDPNANSTIRGTVRQTPHGDIRWTTFSIFHGEERWRSEGIQMGGIRSARGILGNWFDKDYDVHGPAGPTAFWKVSDDIVDEKKRSATANTTGSINNLHVAWAPLAHGFHAVFEGVE